MIKQYSIAEARNHFTSLVRDVERESTIQLTRRGKPVAVLLSIQEYKRLADRQGDFWEAYTAFRERVPAQDLDTEVDFANLRDRSPGRELEW